MGKEMFIGYQLLEWQPQQRLTGKLILSDSPENVREIGILYEEKIDGLGRILFHHINESEDVKNLAIIICNKEGLKKQAKILKQEVMGPTKYILHAGQTLLERYFMGKQKGIITLDPYEEKILFMSLPNEWQPQLLLTGIIDFETDGIVEVIIAAIDKTTSISEIKKLPYLERDKHPRGTFYCLEESYALHLPSFGRYYVRLEDDEDWAVGKDGITQEITMNRGNYGIMYHVTIQAEAVTKVQIVPRAGVFKGVIKWENGQIIPIERTHYFKHCKEPVDLGWLTAGEIRTLSYMLPNGSAAPVWLQFEVINEN
ncbi:hypothetical protein [Cellulosilyticum ruminicola]|uniref:hypothetical protein n=1 Tax=Cellulosilyticum ruminicola TaxID=425254 RepID=UPI0006D258DA|nr:hypothetical protein [Cellulosilyticum ruminicola]